MSANAGRGRKMPFMDGHSVALQAPRPGRTPAVEKVTITIIADVRSPAFEKVRVRAPMTEEL